MNIKVKRILLVSFVILFLSGMNCFDTKEVKASFTICENYYSGTLVCCENGEGSCNALDYINIKGPYFFYHDLED